MIDAVASNELDAEIAIVISNRSEAAGLERARKAGIETVVIDHHDKARFPTREDYDRELLTELRSRHVALVCLAGFMRLLSRVLVEAYPNAILNVHPSLLPSFPGLNPQYQAWEHGAKYSGATVHLVTAELDGGPIVVQEVVPVFDEDDAETLAERILEKEHQLYPRAIQLVLDGNWHLEGRRFLQGRV